MCLSDSLHLIPRKKTGGEEREENESRKEIARETLERSIDSCAVISFSCSLKRTHTHIIYTYVHVQRDLYNRKRISRLLSPSSTTTGPRLSLYMCVVCGEKKYSSSVVADGSSTNYSCALCSKFARFLFLCAMYRLND